MKSKFTETELRAREAATAAYMKKHRKLLPVDEKAAAPFLHLTRFQHSKLVDRERMRHEAESIRCSKRAAEAKASWLAAKAGLEARDRMAQS